MTSPTLLYRCLDRFVLAEGFENTPAYIVNLPAAVEVFGATVADTFIELVLSVCYLARALLTSLDASYPDSLSDCLQASRHFTRALTSAVSIVTAPLLTLFAGPEAIRELYFGDELEGLRTMAKLQESQSRLTKINSRLYNLRQENDVLCKQNSFFYQASQENAEQAEELAKNLDGAVQYIEELKKENKYFGHLLARPLLTLQDPAYPHSSPDCLQAGRQFTQALTYTFSTVTDPHLTSFSGPETTQELYFANEPKSPGTMVKYQTLQSRLPNMNLGSYELMNQHEMLYQKNLVFYLVVQENGEQVEELTEQLEEAELHIEELKRKNKNLAQRSIQLYGQYKADGELLEQASEECTKLKDELSENAVILEEAEETFGTLLSENEELKKKLEQERKRVTYLMEIRQNSISSNQKTRSYTPSFKKKLSANDEGNQRVNNHFSPALNNDKSQLLRAPTVEGEKSPPCRKSVRRNLLSEFTSPEFVVTSP